MSRKVLDSNLGDNDVDTIMNEIIAQNPQLNARIEKVHNESNVFLCKVLRIYSFDDKAYVKILNNNKKVFCRLSHEILGSDMSIDYLPNGVEKDGDKLFNGKKYIQPYDDLYGIVIKVRWNNLDDENVLLGYVNIHGDGDLKSSSNKGELLLNSGSSIISVDDKRINIKTPSLFINGLPYEEPKLNNYYDKKESNIIINNLQEQIQNKETVEVDEITERIDKIEEDLNNININNNNIDLTDYDIDLNINFGASGMTDIITIDLDIVNNTVNKRINI